MDLEQQLCEIFGPDACITEGKRLERYRIDQVGDEAYAQLPAAVVFATHTEQVVRLMRWANQTGTAVTPRGGGTGLAGGAIPVAGGVVCSFERMDQIIEIDTENLMVVTQPGVVTSRLDAALQPHGLFFAGYPMSEDICCVGGNVAENAGGGRAVKYGTTASYVLGAEVVTPTGEILRLGGKRLKDVTGYNLLQLMIGSEGTLGLFTELTIRVIPRPVARAVLFAGFPDSRSAVECVTELKRISALSSVEFIDGRTTRATNADLPASDRCRLPDSADAFLLIEVDETDAAQLSHVVDAAEQTVIAAGGTVVLRGSEPQSSERAWKLRKAVPWWTKRVAGRWHSMEDVVVPPAQVPALVAYADRLRTRYATPVAVFGHAGDGNFHITPMKAQSMSEEQWSSVIPQLLSELYLTVHQLGGTISGEHGIGRKRTRYLAIVLSESERSVMRRIKHALDPNGVLNPGVALDEG